MPFDLNPSPTFVATARITVPGKPAMPLQLRYRHKKKEEYVEFVSREQPDHEMVAEIVENVLDKPSDMTDAQFLDQLLTNFPAAAMDIYITYCRELAESRAKN